MRTADKAFWRQGLVQGMDIDELKNGDRKVGEISKIKLTDRTKRLEMIGKHVDVQAYRERQETNTNFSVTISAKDAETL